MDFNNKEENKVYFLRSNHFVEEYLNGLPINSDLKTNPRFQSIIWYISVVLKRQGIPFNSEEAKTWMQSQIRIGKNGELGYILDKQDNYFLANSDGGVQFVQYSCEDGKIVRQVKEVQDQDTTWEILSFYNDDGIEEKQIVKDPKREEMYMFERIENFPELRNVMEYKVGSEKAIVYQESRCLLAAFEDLNPNLVEVDPLESQPILKIGSLPKFYEEFFTKKKILPLDIEQRQTKFKKYQESNQLFGRTTVFERGIAKLMNVRNRVR